MEINVNRYDDAPRGLGVAAALLAAAVATSAILGSVTWLFDSASQTPWVAADQAATVSQCDGLHGASARHACLRSVLAARKTEVSVAARGAPAISD
jgi:hypothetical protein